MNKKKIMWFSYVCIEFNLIITIKKIVISGEIPSITVSGVGDETEQAPEGSSGECMGPPSVAGTSTETQSGEQQEEMLEGEDGV